MQTDVASTPAGPVRAARVGTLFSHDWDALGFARSGVVCDRAGFALFSWPDNVRLAWFDLERFADAQARRGRRRGWQGVVSHHEQFGALAAALVAERLGLPGNPPEAVLRCQHKLLARQLLQQVAPEANLPFAPLQAEYGGPLPQDLHYPVYVKPVKAAFSVLARPVHDAAELYAHTRFGRRELWVIRRLVEPFERVCRRRLPGSPSAHRMLLEAPVSPQVPQYNLDGWVHEGRVHALGVVDAVMYPGTQSFMRWDLPSRLPTAVQQRALDVAGRFLQAAGFRQGLFNMEFFHDPASDRLSVIEFNPRLASQFSDLYLRTTGMDPHAMSVALARGLDPLRLPRAEPVAGAAASLVYRSFGGQAAPPMPSAALRARWQAQFPDGLLLTMPKRGHELARDLKWLGSHRYGVVHLQGRDAAELRARAEAASALLGWPAPYDGRAAAPPAQDHPGVPLPPAWAGPLAPVVGASPGR
jgi:biotin carboxylase